MGDLNALLNHRLKKGDQSSKMAAMAKQSANGNLTSFSGIFSITELAHKEKKLLEELLRDHSTGKEDFETDLQQLISITSEIKGITNQAAMLHGERIKKAYTILIRYRDGAFTSWLIAAYGNRQTPYNLMLYYEFYEKMPKNLRPQIELMPRQAIYTLASREGPIGEKQKIVENYQGETKAELLTLIREVFPLNSDDRRGQNIGEILIQGLKKICKQFRTSHDQLTETQKKSITEILGEMQTFLGSS